MDLPALISILLSAIQVSLSYEVEELLPEFLPSASNLTYRVGDLVTLPCFVVNLGKEQSVVWRTLPHAYPLTINTMTYVHDDRFAIDKFARPDNISEWNLLIRNVQLKDAGIYECQITTAEGVSQLFYLTVEVISIGGTQYVVKGGLLHLHCYVSAYNNSVSTVDWYRNDKLIVPENDVRYDIKTYKKIKNSAIHSHLKIDSVTALESGSYKCVWGSHESDDWDVYIITGSSAYHEKTGRTNRQSLTNASGHPRTAILPEALWFIALLFACCSR